MTKANRRNNFRTVLCMILIMMWVMATAIPAMAAPRVEETLYHGYGKVEVDFTSNVKYNNVKVSLKDNKGRKYSATINKKGSDELIFTIKNYKKGFSYTYTISGIKRSSDKNYGTVKGTVWIPGATQAPRFKKADYDRDDLEVEIEFKSYVQYKNPKVTITDSHKKNYVVRIVKKGRDSITVKVRKLTIGKRYNFTVSGIRVMGNTSYTSRKGSFAAKDN